MSAAKPWANVAALIKAKNNEGGLSVRATEGLPFLLEPGMEVTFVPPVLRMPRAAHVAFVEQTAQDRFVVTFDAIATRTDAERLEGHFCLVRTADLPEGYAEPSTLDVVGFVVSDAAAGRIGRIARIEDNPAHPLLVVERDHLDDEGAGEDFEVLIPFVDEFIVSVDPAARVVSVDVPQGLLDL